MIFHVFNKENYQTTKNELPQYGHAQDRNAPPLVLVVMTFSPAETKTELIIFFPLAER